MSLIENWTSKWPYPVHPDQAYDVLGLFWRIKVDLPPYARERLPIPRPNGPDPDPWRAHDAVALNPQPLPPGRALAIAAVNIVFQRTVTQAVPDPKARDSLVGALDESLHRIEDEICGSVPPWWEDLFPRPNPQQFVAELARFAAGVADPSSRTEIQKFAAGILQRSLTA